ncbi:hypothetical protein EON65_48505 [archaeon]|nr:MAG: hypothetical protein EON65_48505 [archaeon]
MVAIEVDQRNSGLFRLTLLLNDARYPPLYTHTHTQSPAHQHSTHPPLFAHLVQPSLAHTHTQSHTHAQDYMDCCLQPVTAEMVMKAQREGLGAWLQALATVADMYVHI